MNTQIQSQLERSNASPAQKLLRLSLPHLHDRSEFPYNIRMPDTFYARGALHRSTLEGRAPILLVTVALWYTFCAQEANIPASDAFEQRVQMLSAGSAGFSTHAWKDVHDFGTSAFQFLFSLLVQSSGLSCDNSHG